MNSTDRHRPAGPVENTDQLLADDVVRSPFSIVDSHAGAPDGAGLGIMVDTDRPTRFRTAQ